MTGDPSILEMMTPLQAVIMERVKQDSKWGEQNHTDYEWLSVLTEEVGEVANSICCAYINPEPRESFVDAAKKNMEYEVIQVAAVCFAWLENLKRRQP
jgi:NTP pyrophosphatase (non-canonical NTP hydrolase)